MEVGNIVPSATPIGGNLLSSTIVSGAFEVGFLMFGIVYFIFTLIVLRQVNIMTDTVRTEGGGLLKGLAILYAGLALGVIVLFIGLL